MIERTPEELDALARSCWRLTCRLALDFHRRRPHLDPDELLSAASIGLLFAVRHFDPALGALTTIVHMSVMRRLHAYAASAPVRQQRAKSLDERRPDASLRYDPPDRRGSPVVDTTGEIFELLDRPADIALAQRLAQGDTLAQIAADRGVSRPRVGQLVKRLRQRLREALDNL